jgi:hypothetical protein
MPETQWRPEPWSDSQLIEDANLSLEALNESQRAVTSRRATYASSFAEACQFFDLLMENSGDLLNLTGTSFNSDKDLVAMGRFTGGPMISNDDLERIAGRTGLVNKNIDPELADNAAAIIKELIDPDRFPWVGQSRMPYGDELHAARIATAAIWATQRAQTRGRGQARSLETKVMDVLEQSGLNRVKKTSGLPWSLGLGSFCDEGLVSGTKCDVIAHLRAHEKALLIECKVSATAINGSKRLKSIKDAATDWWRGNGEQVLVVGAISGAFHLADLQAAQRHGLFLVWEHNLEPIGEIVRAYTGR